MVKTTKTTTSKTAAKTAPIPTPAPTPAPAAELEAATPDTSTTVFDQFAQFLSKLQAVSASMSSLRTEFRGLERQVSKELKAAAKITAKRKRKTGNRAPSGFVKPTLLFLMN